MHAEHSNWAGSLTYAARRIHHPASVDEVRELVRAGTRLRALGSRHSFSRVADTDGDLVRLDGLPKTVTFDHTRPAVTVPAGMTYGEVSRQVHDHGYALHNLGSLPHISIAGAVATATHGSGDANRNLAASVSALQLVTADGGLITVSRESDPARFPGMVVALGALGIVVAVTLDLVPSFDIRQDVYEGLDRATLEQNFDEIFASAYSVSVFTDWSAPSLTGWLKRRVDEPDVRAPVTWMGATRADTPRHPVPGMPAANCTEQLGVAGPWFDRLPHFRAGFTPSNGDEVQSEFLVPRAAAVDALRALDAISRQIAPVLQICEIRTVAADDLWLSPAYACDVVGLHFTWVNDTAGVLPVVRSIERQLEPFDARPHWGKLFTLPAETIPALFPRLADFRSLRRDMDPDGVFGNAFVDHLVG